MAPASRRVSGRCLLARRALQGAVMRLRPVVPPLALLVGALGCSISASSWSLSKSSESVSNSSGSVSGSLESSSNSLRGGPSESERAYEDAVAERTAAYVATGGSIEAFQSSLAQIARDHGVSDWESSRATWVGVGQGLARARVTGGSYDAFVSSLAGDDARKRSAIEEGYRGTQQ